MTALRFFLACVSLFLAAFVILPAPTVLLFQLKYAVTEFGHWFVLLPLVVIFMGRRRNQLDSASAAMALIAAILFISTPIRAAAYAGEAARKMRQAFPEVQDDRSSAPFSFGRIWSFGDAPASQPETMKYTDAGGEELKLDFYSAEG